MPKFRPRNPQDMKKICQRYAQYNVKFLSNLCQISIKSLSNEVKMIKKLKMKNEEIHSKAFVCLKFVKWVKNE